MILKIIISKFNWLALVFSSISNMLAALGILQGSGYQTTKEIQSPHPGLKSGEQSVWVCPWDKTSKGNGPKQGQRKTLSRVGLEAMIFQPLQFILKLLRSFNYQCYTANVSYCTYPLITCFSVMK